MKKTNRTILAMTAAVVALTGCVKENLAPQGTEDGMVTVTLIADDATTKTQINTAGNNVIWTPKNELKYFYADQIRIKDSEITQNDLANNKISFSLNVSQGTQKINGFLGGRINTRVMRKDIIEDGTTKSTKVTAFGIELPSVQTTRTKTFDPEADVLIMPEVTLDSKNSQQKITINNIKYKRLNAITKLVITLNEPETPSEEHVQSIKFATTKTNLAGSFTYDYNKNSYVDINGKEQAGVFFTENPSKEISLYYPGQPKLQDIEYTLNKEKRTAYGINAFMVSAPVTLAEETVTITMTTNIKEYVKTIQIPNEGFTLKNTQLNQIVIDMTGVIPTTQSTQVYRFDLTKAPTLNNAQSGLNSFTGLDRFRYDEKTPNLVFVADPDMQYDQNTTSSHVMKAGQSFSIQGEAIKSVDIIMANEHNKNHTAIFSTDHGKCTDNASGATWVSDIAKGRHKVVFMLNKTVNKANIKEIIVRYDDTTGETEDVRFDTELSTPITDFAADATSATAQTVDLYNTRFDLDPLKITATDPSTNPYPGDTKPSKFTVTLSEKTGEGNKLSVAVKSENIGTEAVEEAVWIYNKYTSYKLTLKQLASGQVSVEKEVINCKAGEYTGNLFEFIDAKWTKYGLRLAYSNNTASKFTVKVKDTASTIKIKKIVVETASTDITSDPATGWSDTDKVWTGDATSVTFKNSNERVDITKLTIHYTK